MTQSKDPFAGARLLTEAGRSRMPPILQDGDEGSFWLLQPVQGRLPVVLPAVRGRAATYTARELQMVLRRPRRCHPTEVPTVVPDDLVKLVRFDHVRRVPIPDDHLVQRGSIPITYLTALHEVPQTAWTTGLNEAGLAAACSLRDHGVRLHEVAVDWHSTRKHATVEVLMAHDLDGLTVNGRGIFTTVVDNFRLTKTNVTWLTYEVKWTNEVTRDYEMLPGPTGHLVIQATGDSMLTGLLRLLGTPFCRVP